MGMQVIGMCAAAMPPFFTWSCDAATLYCSHLGHYILLHRIAEAGLLAGLEHSLYLGGGVSCLTALLVGCLVDFCFWPPTQ